MEEELRQTLVLAQRELEDTRRRAEEEIRNRDDQLIQLKLLLSRADMEKHESDTTLQRLLSDKFVLQNKIQLLRQCKHGGVHESGIGIGFDYIDGASEEKLRQRVPRGISAVEDEPRRKLDSNGSNNNNSNGFSDSDESIVSSPVFDPIPPTIQLPLPSEQDPITHLILDQPLPEKGKLLMAVMKAGPLLQTLMLAGPLPQWRHPPPPLDSYQIPTPPVMMKSANIPPRKDSSSSNNDEPMMRVMRKRELCGGSDFSRNKQPRFVL